MASRRPADTPFKQQRLNAWQPILTPTWVIGTFFLIGITFIPIGISLLSQSNAVKEMSIQYDGSGTPNSQSACMIQATNEGYANNKSCTVTFNVAEDMDGPVYVYYELTNFYQNHRKYVKSLSFKQLRGEVTDHHDLADCAPLDHVVVGGATKALNPCGLVANSLFNDVFNLTSSQHPSFTDSGIAWSSDVDSKFGQPEGFSAAECLCGGSDASTTPPGCSSASMCGPSGSPGAYGCGSSGTAHLDASTSTCYAYTYPDDDNTQYLYESYPMVVQPQEGVLNEHFIVWMRTAGLPKFRKLYGIINTDLKAGDAVTFEVSPNFNVASFAGTKSLVLSTVSWFGGKNPFLGYSYIVVGAACVVAGGIFGVKHMVRPRKLGDTRYLVWKEA
mmetsp:Transcript_9162/g.18343  ORF Transcript_9162/g.18343 Transcript_9162/m.18343 type:complete len:388 (-) Transcript_9162:110-1273(-)|eukprot:CAMPEP_0182461830 /NCGR_PEP_ID=MMETSP1319-20130603/6285_1 /TAXON_ID=172717 /ORGANISM="Bolidomonas pacifica, Strain RCC208" /LENGTH=387 /DNA_ID=CAMNT_0024661175 /DNA_START=94 /DNA_END=1257 /DNA_ORIENTATION=+